MRKKSKKTYWKGDDARACMGRVCVYVCPARGVSGISVEAESQARMRLPADFEEAEAHQISSSFTGAVLMRHFDIPS